LATTIGQDTPKVKLRHQQVHIAICPSMMHDDALLRTALYGNTTVNEMTSATLLKIEGVSSSKRYPYRDGLW
jgi:hypothetical protein